MNGCTHAASLEDFSLHFSARPIPHALCGAGADETQPTPAKPRKQPTFPPHDPSLTKADVAPGLNTPCVCAFDFDLVGHLVFIEDHNPVISLPYAPCSPAMLRQPAPPCLAYGIIRTCCAGGGERA